MSIVLVLIGVCWKTRRERGVVRCARTVPHLPMQGLLCLRRALPEPPRPCSMAPQAQICAPFLSNYPFSHSLRGVESYAGYCGCTITVLLNSNSQSPKKLTSSGRLNSWTEAAGPGKLAFPRTPRFARTHALDCEDLRVVREYVGKDVTVRVVRLARAGPRI